jgi:predicted protein tyrosine phosphatase
MSDMNRMYNAKNPYQKDFKKVLCVCSAGLLRSPTTAVVLAGEPFNYNTRAVGIDEGHALIPISDVLVHWADEIVVMNEDIRNRIEASYPKFSGDIINLDIEDNYAYRDKELIERINVQYRVWAKKI